MSYRYYVGYRPQRSFGSPFARAVDAAFGFVARAFRAARARAWENSAISILSDLDDRTLRNIGVPRSEIRSVTRKLAEHPGMDYRATYHQ